MEVKTFTFTKETVAKRLFMFAMVFMMVCSFNLAKAQSDTIQINFGANTVIPRWNSMGNFGQALEPTKLKNTKGVETSVGLMVTGTFIANNYAGTTEPDPSIGIPGTVTSSNWYSARNTNSGFLLSGLNPEKEYTFIVFGSILRTDGNLREGMYTFIGTNEVVLYNNSTMNLSEVAIGMVTPDAEGKIMVKCESSPNNGGTGPGGNFHLSAMKIIYPDETTGLNSEKTNLMNVFPNPAKDIVNVELAELSQVRILDITGKILVEKTVKAGRNSIPLNLKSGIYLLQVAGQNKSVSTTKLLVE